MLGAQARAAELQAAKSAALRQRAHREAEDHILPPELPSASLTEFARTPLQSKNKGVKAFRPLADSDFEFEAKQNRAESQVSNSVASLEDDTSMTIPPIAVPVAPRAMLNHSDSYLSKITPSRMRATVFTPRSQGVNTPARIADEYRVSGAVSSSPGADTVPNTLGYVFGPEDLSPSKQESKHIEMDQQQHRSYPLQTLTHHLPPFVPDAAIFTPQQHFGYESQFQYVDTYSQTGTESYTYNRPHLQQHHSELGTLATGHFSNQTHIIQRHLDQTQSFADDLVDHHHQIQQHTRAHDQLQLPQPVLSDNQPYDRNTKMQSFVAAQQAIAKKGKTVLHNPDLYRLSKERGNIPMSTSTISVVSPGSDYQSLSAANFDISIWELEQRNARVSGDKEFDPRALVEENSPKQSSPTIWTVQPNDATTEPSDEQEPQQLPDEVLSPSWSVLRPVTAREKDIMLYKLRRLNAECDSSLDSFATPTTVVGNRAYRSLQREPRDSSTKHTAALKVVADFEKRRNHSSEYGAIGRPVSRNLPDLSSRGGLTAIAGIMAAIHDCADNHKNEYDDNSYTPAPPYAVVENTDRSSSMNGFSLFDSLDFEVGHGGGSIHKVKLSSFTMQ